MKLLPHRPLTTLIHLLSVCHSILLLLSFVGYVLATGTKLFLETDVTTDVFIQLRPTKHLIPNYSQLSSIIIIIIQLLNIIPIIFLSALML
jgi:hypothetical protein